MTAKLSKKRRAAPSFVVPLGGQLPMIGSLRAVLSLAGLLLMLSSPAFAKPAPAVLAPDASQPAQVAPAPQLPQQLAWQRVGSPISLAS
jgi:hypothetical protein